MEKITILVVDDETNVGICVKCAIEDILSEMRLPAEVLFESNPKKVMRIVSNNVIDIVLSDVDMPGMSGEELIEMIKVVSPYTVPLLMTGRTNFQLRKEFCDVTVIEKPFREDLLKEALAENLEYASYMTYKQ